jgi:hypothetical protein
MGGAGRTLRVILETGSYCVNGEATDRDHVHEIWKVHTLKVVFSGVHVRVRRVSWAVLYAL